MIVNSIEEAVELLNRILECDPLRISQFFNLPHLVDSSAADTPFEFAPSAFARNVSMFPLGLLNGFFAETGDDGQVIKRIHAEYSDTGSSVISRFVVAGGDMPCLSSTPE